MASNPGGNPRAAHVCLRDGGGQLSRPACGEEPVLGAVSSATRRYAIWRVVPPLRDCTSPSVRFSVQLAASRSTGQSLGRRCGTNPKLELTRHEKTPY